MYGGNAIFNIQRAITLKAGKQELRFMCSACHLMVFNICVKLHETRASAQWFKIMERTNNLLTDTNKHREKTKTIYPIALHTSYAWGITRVTFMYSAFRLMV